MYRMESEINALTDPKSGTSIYLHVHIYDISFDPKRVALH